MAITWSLSTIRAKVRKHTGRPTTTQITDGDVDNFIDNYYRNVLPLQTFSEEFEKFKSSTGFTGTTTAGVGEYALGSDLWGLKPPLIFNNEEIPLSFDLQKFLLDFPPSNTTQTQPTHGCLFERTLYLRPLPDDNAGSNYSFEAPKIDKPTALTADADEPLDQLWGPLIAYGASLDILSEHEEDTDTVAGLMEAYVSLVFRKDIASEIGRSAFPKF